MPVLAEDKSDDREAFLDAGDVFDVAFECIIAFESLEKGIDVSGIEV